MQQAASAGASRSPFVAAFVIGIALGGFIDGILLHQVLQWHHLLSLVEGEAFRDLGTQILFDGLFHVLMYVVALVGLWLLWRARGSMTGRGSDLQVVAAALLGFGVWQVIDVVGFHWIAGIHRIRVDVPNPLFWDIAWLVVFGAPSLAGGWWLLKRTPPDDGAGRGDGLRAVPAALAALAIVAGPVAALPPAGTTNAMVVFRPGIDPAQAFAAVADADARIIWASQKGDVLAIDLGDDAKVRRLYQGGALMVSSSPFVVGCLAWSRV